MKGVSALAKEIKTLWHKTLKVAGSGAGLSDSTSSGPTVHNHNHSIGFGDTAVFMGLTVQQAQHLRLDTQRPRDKLLLTAYRLPHRLEHPIICSVLLFLSLNHSVIFEIAPKHTISDSLTDYDVYSISSKWFLPTVVDVMVIWIKFTHSSTFYFTDR